MFHPLIQNWFIQSIGTPTTVQTNAWPVIGKGIHVLVTAPTGSGKTLTAFLWGLNQLISGKWPVGTTQILYISPLKALNNDIQRNLLRPLAGINTLFRQQDLLCPTIRVLTRSGDTPQKDRRKMLRKPPEILITTPESLNIMLSSKHAGTQFKHLKTVILDEIHAVAESPRGVHLMTAIERLVPIAGEFQRIALSATVKPLQTVADMVAGMMPGECAETTAPQPRPITIVNTPERKDYALTVRFPPVSDLNANRDNFWEPVARDMRQIMDAGTSTLIFANNRRLCEKLTLRINRQEGQLVAYAHHGALAKGLRLDVERRLKQGQLKAIVATSSLEMGIDIGDLDRVVMVQTPKSIASAVQRAGRANHQVGQTSHATLYPVYSGDTLEAAVMARAIVDGDIEAVTPMEAPLDVLAQVLVSMVCAEPWDIDAIYQVVRSAWAYRNLDRSAFDLVLQMLAGKYAGTRLDELKARVFIDQETNTVSALSNARLALYGAGGMIPNRGYYQLRHAQTRAKIGELDEEFVWEARLGDRFTLGSQKWRIEKITHSDVLVAPAEPSVTATPFWKADALNRSWHFSEKILRFLETIEQQLSAGQDITGWLTTHHFMEDDAAKVLQLYLQQQRLATSASLPHRHHIIIEHVLAGPDDSPGNQFVIHTLWGGNLNRPLAMALETAWQREFGGEVEIYPDNNQIAVQLPETGDASTLLKLVTADTVDALIGNVLEFSGLFGARFRESAGRAMLIQRQRLRQRLPLWMTRLKAQKLLEKVKKYKDFPVLLEAWRGCLMEEFDMPKLKLLLTEIADGTIAVSHVTTPSPSPMAQSGAWSQVNQYMYENDASKSRQSSQLDRNLVESVVQQASVRPAIPQDVIDDYVQRRQRLMPGYGPETEADLMHYIADRQLVRAGEWTALADAGTPSEVMEAVRHRLEIDAVGNLWLRGTFLETPGSPLLDPSFSLVRWLGFYGPMTVKTAAQMLNVSHADLAAMLTPLVDDQVVISGPLIENNETSMICRSDTYEGLLRRYRRWRRQDSPILPVTALAPCLARFQGLRSPVDNRDAFMDRLTQLAGFPATPELWEQAMLPDRCRGYRPEWLDGWMRDSAGIWLGTGSRRLTFLDDSDRDLLEQSWEEAEDLPDNTHLDVIDALFTEPGARYDFTTLLGRTNLAASDLMDQLWTAVWSGLITTDTFETVRRAMAVKFQSPEMVDSGSSTTEQGGRGIPGRSRSESHGTPVRGGLRRRSLRRRFQNWRHSLPFPGAWLRPVPIAYPETEMDREELLRDRARMILDRYGIVFRELLDRELPGFRWRDLFRTFQVMELAGEINAGLFFHGIQGIQFASNAFVKMIKTPLDIGPDDEMLSDVQTVYSMNACDPASVCGLRLEGMPSGLPDRRPTNRVVFRGSQPVLMIENSGRKLTFRIKIDDPDMATVLDHFARVMHRAISPVTKMTINTINGKPADNSPYIDILRHRFDLDTGGGKIVLYRRF